MSKEAVCFTGLIFSSVSFLACILSSLLPARLSNISPGPSSNPDISTLYWGLIPMIGIGIFYILYRRTVKEKGSG